MLSATFVRAEEQKGAEPEVQDWWEGATPARTERHLVPCAQPTGIQVLRPESDCVFPWLLALHFAGG